MSNEYNNLDNVIELKDYIVNESKTEEPQLPVEDIFKNLEQAANELEKKGASPVVLMGQVLHGLKEYQDGCSDEDLDSIREFMTFVTTVFVGIRDENPDISPRDHMSQFVNVLIEAFESASGEDDNGEQS